LILSVHFEIKPVSLICEELSAFIVGMYRISGSGWPDIRPFSSLQLRLRHQIKCSKDAR